MDFDDGDMNLPNVTDDYLDSMFAPDQPTIVPPQIRNAALQLDSTTTTVGNVNQQPTPMEITHTDNNISQKMNDGRADPSPVTSLGDGTNRSSNLDSTTSTSSPPSTTVPASSSVIASNVGNENIDMSDGVPSPSEEGGNEDEPEAPLGTNLSDDDENGIGDPESSGEDEQNGRQRRSSGFGASALDYIDSDEDSEDIAMYDADEYAAANGAYTADNLENQHAEESAVACGLPSLLMHPLELEYMPEFADYPLLYTNIRNLICLHWQRALSTYLTFDQFLLRSDLDTNRLRACAKRIFDFLNVHGFINCGLLPITKDAPTMRPIDQQRPQVEPFLPLVRRKSNELASPPPASTVAGENGIKAEESVKIEANGDVAMKMEDEPLASPAAAAAPATAPVPFTPKRVIVIGAGASGLAAARQLQSFGHEVIVLEGRSRIGGRVNTNRDIFSVPVDLGASIMTGLYGSPLNILSKQMSGGNFEVGFSTMKVFAKATVERPNNPFPDLMHYIRDQCPLYLSTGSLVDKSLDARMEALWNKLLAGEYPLKVNSGHPCEMPADALLTKEEMEKIRLPNPEDLPQMDVETGIQICRKILDVRVNPVEESVLNWHAANLEYGCATPLNKLSLLYWDQDDAQMPWEGDHALIKKGFGTFIDHLSKDVDIRQNIHVNSIVYSDSTASSSSSLSPVDSKPVRVWTKHNDTGVEQEFVGDYVVCTASLGVLKTGDLQFQPPLPQWKQTAITNLGFGLLNKLILEFDTAFWKNTNDKDMFGYVSPGPASERGKFYIFWNLERSHGKPVLAALCSGEAAYASEGIDQATLVAECMKVLRTIHPNEVVPDPIRTHQTRWSQDRYARGSYSFVATGNDGKEYDQLAKPVGTSLYFAGEACNRDYPATVPGAYLSGLRAAGQVQSHIFQWNRIAAADVLRELEKQRKSQQLSKSDARATQQAHQAYRAGEDHSAEAVQHRLLDIMQRQRRRKGIRHEFAPKEIDDGEFPQAQEENLAAKLEQAARLLKQGLFGPPRESITRPAPVNTRFAHVKGYTGTLERPFDARTVDNQGLPSFVSFQDFEGKTFNPTGTTSIPSSGDTSAKHKSRRDERHDKKRRAASKDKRRAEAERHSKKHRSSSGKAIGSSATPEQLIHRHVGKVVLTCASSFPGAREKPKLLKQVQRKAGGKVVDDWNSKPRGSLPMSDWLNEKRKQRIEELVRKYLDQYSQSSSSHPAPSNDHSSALPSSSGANAAPPQQRGPRFNPTTQ